MIRNRLYENGTYWNKTVLGTDSSETLRANTLWLDDRLFGGGGNDTLYGYAGNDSLIGDAGNDLLVGGEHAGAVEHPRWRLRHEHRQLVPRTDDPGLQGDARGDGAVVGPSGPVIAEDGTAPLRTWYFRIAARMGPLLSNWSLLMPSLVSAAENAASVGAKTV